MSKWQKILYRCLGGAIFLTSLVLLFTVPSYRFALSRLGEALGAFGRSVAYLFCDLLGLSRVPEQTLNNPITEPIREFAGIDFTVFFEKVRNTVPAMFHGQHFLLFLSWLFYCTVRLLCYGCYVFLAGILCYIPILIYSDETNNDYATDTKPLALFKRFYCPPGDGDDRRSGGLLPLVPAVCLVRADGADRVAGAQYLDGAACLFRVVFLFSRYRGDRHRAGAVGETVL